MSALPYWWLWCGILPDVGQKAGVPGMFNGPRKWYWDARAAVGERCQSCLARTRALQFHHRDPATKCFTLGSAPTRTTRAQWRAELAKCELLCRSCHAERHVALNGAKPRQPKPVPPPPNPEQDTPRQARLRRYYLAKAAKRRETPGSGRNAAVMAPMSE